MDQKDNRFYRERDERIDADELALKVDRRQIVLGRKFHDQIAMNHG